MKQILILSSLLLSLAACAPAMNFDTQALNGSQAEIIPTAGTLDISFDEINIGGGFAQAVDMDVVVEYSIGTVVTGPVVNQDSTLNLGFTATVLN